MGTELGAPDTPPLCSVNAMSMPAKARIYRGGVWRRRSSVADSNNLITVPFSYFYNEMILFHTFIRIQPADDINLQGQKVWKTTIKAYIFGDGIRNHEKAV